MACAGGTATVNPAAGPGNLIETDGITQTGGVLFGAAVYRGEQGGGLRYWDVALGLNGGVNCLLTARGTASAAAFDALTTPVGWTWPFVVWSVALTDGDGAVACHRHALADAPSTGVDIAYTDPDAPRAFAHTYPAAPGSPLPTGTFSVTDLDTAGSAWLQPIIGADGNPFIAYVNAPQLLKTAACADVACTSATLTQHESTTAYWLSAALGGDGRPFIAYHATVADVLRGAHCTTADCTSATYRTIDSQPHSGWYPSVTIGGDGLPIIASALWATYPLQVNHCNDAVCSSSNLTTPDGSAGAGNDPIIITGTDGLPLIVHGNSAHQLSFARCTNATCTTFNAVSLGVDAFSRSFAVGADGLPIVAYQRTNSTLAVIHCGDVDCATRSETLVDASGTVGQHVKVAVGVDDKPLLAYRDESNVTLRVVHCNDAACTTSTGVAVLAATGWGVGLMIGSDHLPFITAMIQPVSGYARLTAIHCGDVTCTPPP